MKFLRTLSLALFCSILLLGSLSADEAKKINVGLYKSIGAEGMKAALSSDNSFNVELIEKLDKDTIFKYDVVILGVIKGGLPNQDWQDALEVYARSGGGVMMNHDSTGFRGWRKPLFPMICQGIDKDKTREALVTDNNDPVTKGLPEKFEHAYTDHIVLKSGPDGKILMKDSSGNPLVISGTINNGRIMGNGMITGLTFQRPEGNLEKAPEGAERTFFLNAVKWLTEKPLTQLADDEKNKRKKEYANQISIRETADVAAGNTKATASGQKTSKGEWFSPTWYNEQGFIHPPIELMTGRFFLFDGTTLGVATRREDTLRSYEETLAVMQQLKWAGVTDIICYTNGLVRANYPSEVPGISLTSQGEKYKRLNFDLLETLEKAAGEVGLNIWCFWHSGVKGLSKTALADAEKYLIKDSKGSLAGRYIDILNPELLILAKKVIDEYAVKYNKHGALKGIFLDELWHPFAMDYMEDNVDAFIGYSKEKYGEVPPANIRELFSKGKDWREPGNAWWRRYILWRDTHMANFTKSVTEYANSKGLQVIAQPAFPLTWDKTWFSGLGGTHRLASLGNFIWSYEGRFNFLYEDYPNDRTIFGTHGNAHNGLNMVSLIRGNNGSIFALNSIWEPFSVGCSPRTIENMERTIRGNREWYGAEKLDKSAVLVNEYGLILGQKDCHQAFKNNDALIRDRLSYSVRTSMVLVENTEFFKKYNVLIAPKYSLEYISAKTYAELLKFMQDGGMLIVCGGKVSVSEEDHTKVVDKTVELLGLTRTAKTEKLNGPLVFSDGNKFEFPAVIFEDVEIKDSSISQLVTAAAVKKPLATCKKIGNGTVVSLNFDMVSLLADDSTVDKAVKFLTALQKPVYQPPVHAEGDVKVYSNLKKGNWVVATFLHRNVDFYEVSDEGRYPVRGKLFVDTKALGLNFDKFRVYSLARDREMMPQGKNVSFGSGKYWTPEILKDEGVDVVLMPNSETDLAIDLKTDDAYLNRWILPLWNERRKTRSYEHEIIAIAPIGEASMLGNTLKKKSER